MGNIRYAQGNTGTTDSSGTIKSNYASKSTEAQIST